MNARSEYEERTRLGKFEGEQAYVPYFYDQYLDGGADEDDGDVLTFNVTEDDRFIFPELDKDVVRIREDDQGFVSEI